MVVAMLFGFLSFTATVDTHAQYGEYVRCENIRDQARKDRCNARIEALVQRRIENINTRLTERIIRIINGNSRNKRALILSAMNVAYWQIWNIFNVIFPLVS